MAPGASAKSATTAQTWWGERWIAALGRLVDAQRLSQGRWHARNGRVVRLDVTRGSVIARLEGGMAVPRTVSIRLAPLSDAEWNRVLAAMAAEARYHAQLLCGQMPDQIETVFETAGTGLFPQTKDGVSLACTCSEARRGLGPCKHAAAVCFALGERLDMDPLLLFELRGRTRAQLSAALRALRTTGTLQESPPPPVYDPARPAPVRAAGFWSCPGGEAELEAVEALVSVTGPRPSRDAEAILTFGAPPFYPEPRDFVATMVGAYRAIAQHATTRAGVDPSNGQRTAQASPGGAGNRLDGPDD